MSKEQFKPKIKKILVCGFGINDADYRTQWYVDGKRKRCPYYARWHMMLNRSYSPKFHALQPNYTDVSVSEEWRYFSKFKSWMETQDWEGLTLDKDILFPGNKIYGPDTCAFVPQGINLLLTDRLSLRGEYPLGVSYQQKSWDMVNELKRPFSAAICRGDGKTKGLGRYATPMEAHKAWQLGKSKAIQVAVSKYAQQPYFDTKVADALMSRAWKLLLDRELGLETKQL